MEVQAMEELCKQGVFSNVFFLFGIISSMSISNSFVSGFCLSFWYFQCCVRSCYTILDWNKNGLLGFWYCYGFEFWPFGLLWLILWSVRAYGIGMRSYQGL